MKSILRLPLRSPTGGNTFSAARAWISFAAQTGFSGMLLTDFGRGSGSAEDMRAFCRAVKDGGLHLYMDVGCLYDGREDPSDMLRYVGDVCSVDGWFLHSCDMRFPGVFPFLQEASLTKNIRWYVTDAARPIPEVAEGKRPVLKEDGGLFLGYDTEAAFTSADIGGALAEQTEALTFPKYRGVSFLYPAFSDKKEDVRAVLTYLLADTVVTDISFLLPTEATGVAPLLSFAEKRRVALLKALHTFDLFYSVTEGKPDIKSPTPKSLLLGRKTEEGEITLSFNLEKTPLVQKDKRILTFDTVLGGGLYRAEDECLLVSDGYVVTFRNKTHTEVNR